MASATGLQRGAAATGSLTAIWWQVRKLIERNCVPAGPPAEAGTGKGRGGQKVTVRCSAQVASCGQGCRGRGLGAGLSHGAPVAAVWVALLGRASGCPGMGCPFRRDL